MLNYEIKGRVWITSKNGDMFLGQGRVELLRMIDEHGSIKKAAQAMKMSYKKAWEQVASMNAQGPEPLVTPKTGGVGGGGSVLSEVGKRAIEVYTSISESNRSFLQQSIEKNPF